MLANSRILALASILCAGMFGQTEKRLEFEVASVKPASDTGFHVVPETGSGGPGTSDPGMFRCSSCTAAALIAKAFDLRNYQFPGRASLGSSTFQVAAAVPAGTNEDDFRVMLQNFLRNRFGLAWHFETKSVRGYHLVVAPKGPTLTAANSQRPRTKAAGSGWGGRGGDHSHNGAVLMFGSARYRAAQQTIAEFARMLSDQLSLPVEDRTGLTGAYDISLTWAGNENHGVDQAAGAAGGFHDHGGGAGSGFGAVPADNSGPTLFDALQSQLGLRLVSAERVSTRVLVIDHIEKQPTAN